MFVLGTVTALALELPVPSAFATVSAQNCHKCTCEIQITADTHLCRSESSLQLLHPRILEPIVMMI